VVKFYQTQNEYSTIDYPERGETLNVLLEYFQINGKFLTNLSMEMWIYLYLW